MFWMSCRVPILLTCLWCTVNGAVSISPKNEFPMKGESFTLTCTNTNPSNNINWGLEYAGSSSVLTTCIASTDNTCLPIRTGYTFTSDVSNNTFNMQIDSVSLSNCGIYTCNDATTFDSDPLTVNISELETSSSEDKLFKVCRLSLYTIFFTLSENEHLTLDGRPHFSSSSIDYLPPRNQLKDNPAVSASFGRSGTL
ncbi:hypothetical protein MAR_021671 [Mya arenaria]|uniref:Immunoglobulin V-set domain-containing protein n=1 Tax=Mya arenaria TaxID=6604 RepID=A0ABY7EBJ4_MYAAR|nr:hypothetical protein MAR_021671 [Mya arenaria]